jgi:hypothetical protein
VKISLFILLLGCLISCSEKETEAKDSKPVIHTVAAINIEINEDANLDKSAQELLNALEEQKESKVWYLGTLYDLMTDGMEDVHANQSMQKFAKLNKQDIGHHLDQTNTYFSDIINHLDKDLDDSRNQEPFWLKVSMEKHLQKSFGEIKYNAEHTHLINISADKRLQCYSGTYNLNVLYRRAYDLEQFQNKNLVIIYEPGHILNGFVKNNRLFGIESTTLGKSLIDYGQIKDLKGNIRVVDAQYFAIYENLKKYLKNPINFANQALKETAKKYDMDQVLEIPASTNFHYDENTLLNYNYGVFSVPGKKDLPSGDLKREKMEIMKREDIPADGNPNILRDGSQITKISADLRDYENYFAITQNAKETHVKSISKKSLIAVKTGSRYTLDIDFNVKVQKENVKKRLDLVQVLKDQVYAGSPQGFVLVKSTKKEIKDYTPLFDKIASKCYFSKCNLDRVKDFYFIIPKSALMQFSVFDESLMLAIENNHIIFETSEFNLIGTVDRLLSGTLTSSSIVIRHEDGSAKILNSSIPTLRNWNGIDSVSIGDEIQSGLEIDPNSKTQRILNQIRLDHSDKKLGQIIESLNR